MESSGDFLNANQSDERVARDWLRRMIKPPTPNNTNSDELGSGTLPETATAAPLPEAPKWLLQEL